MSSDVPVTTAAEDRARRWYDRQPMQVLWGDLPDDERQRLIAAASRRHVGQCAYPECGGDCLECAE